MYNYGTIETHTEFWALCTSLVLFLITNCPSLSLYILPPTTTQAQKKSYKKKKTLYVMSHEAIANKVRIIYGVH